MRRSTNLRFISNFFGGAGKSVGAHNQQQNQNQQQQQQNNPAQHMQNAMQHINAIMNQSGQRQQQGGGGGGGSWSFSSGSFGGGGGGGGGGGNPFGGGGGGGNPFDQMLEWCSRSHAMDIARRMNIDLHDIKFTTQADGTVKVEVEAPNATPLQIEQLGAAVQEECPVARYRKTQVKNNQKSMEWTKRIGK